MAGKDNFRYTCVLTEISFRRIEENIHKGFKFKMAAYSTCGWQREGVTYAKLIELEIEIESLEVQIL